MIKDILTPSLEQLVSDVHYATLNGFKLIKDDAAYMHGWQFACRMFRPDDYSTEEKPALSRQEAMAVARETLATNRAAAVESGMTYREYMDGKEAAEKAEE